MFNAKSPTLAIRALHLDLKGLPPTGNRLLQLLDIASAARFNCVLAEWEDTYPWTFDRSIRCRRAYSDETVNRFLDRAEELSIEVIPLIQSFGHLENILGRRPYAKLREKPETVSDLCPLNPLSRPLIESLIDDILRLHRGRIRRLHLGGDEVWTLGSCPKCRKFVKSQGKAALYLHHISPLLGRVHSAGLTPILWDDMMRHWSDDMLRSFAPKAQLMAWSYAADPFAWLKCETLQRFKQAGIQLWGAGAYKGADGPNAELPNLATRSRNMEAWARAAGPYSLIGVAATAWSRYNTYLTPCESMEASLDALVMAGAILWDGQAPENLEQEAQSLLRTGALRKLAGPQFWSCREAAREFSECWSQTLRLLEQSRQFPHLAGVKDRFSPAAAGQFRANCKQNTQRLKKAAAIFKKSHANRVPALWLSEYTNSRSNVPTLLARTLSCALDSSAHKGQSKR